MEKNALLNVATISPTPRKNRLYGMAADAALWASRYAAMPDPVMPMGYANPPLAIASEVLGLPAIARTLDRISYGEPLTTGKGMTLKPRDDTTEAAMALLPSALKSPKTTLGLAGALFGGGVGDASRAAVHIPIGGLSSSVGDAERFAEMVRKLGPQYEPVIEVANGGSVYVTVNRVPLNKSGAPAKNRNASPTGFKGRFADHPSYWGASASSDPFTGNTAEDLFRLFQQKQGLAQPAVGESITEAFFDPSTRIGKASESVFVDAVSNRGNPVQKFVSYPPAPFSLLDANK